jgi:hypothetical protein
MNKAIRFARIKKSDELTRCSLLFDVLSFPVKLAAAHYCPTHTLQAELNRTAIHITGNTLNFVSNFHAERAPDEFRNYGYGKVKNLLAYIPAGMFCISGLTNMISPLLSTSITVLGPGSSVAIPVLCVAFLMELGRIDRTVSLIRDEQMTVGERLTFFWKAITKVENAEWISEQELKTSFCNLLGVSIPLLVTMIGGPCNFPIFDRLG